MIEVMVNGKWYYVDIAIGVYIGMLWLQEGNGAQSGFVEISGIEAWKLDSITSNKAECINYIKQVTGE
jgi:hypothetical protein